MHKICRKYAKKVGKIGKKEAHKMQKMSEVDWAALTLSDVELTEILAALQMTGADWQALELRNEDLKRWCGP